MDLKKYILIELEKLNNMDFQKRDIKEVRYSKMKKKNI
jgi:hypothetical protein